MTKEIRRNILPSGVILEDEEAWIGDELPEGFRPMDDPLVDGKGRRVTALQLAVASCIDNPGVWRIIKTYDPSLSVIPTSTTGLSFSFGSCRACKPRRRNTSSSVRQGEGAHRGHEVDLRWMRRYRARR
jgi:hypothetical protein